MRAKLVSLERENNRDAMVSPFQQYAGFNGCYYKEKSYSYTHATVPFRVYRPDTMAVR